MMRPSWIFGGLFLMCALGSPAYYELAIEYVSLNAWDMALHAFDALRKELMPADYRWLALLWGIVLNFGLSRAHQKAADELACAGAAATDPSERLRFANEAFRLKHVGRVHQGAVAELVGSLLEVSPVVPRSVEVRLPKRYNFTVQPDSDEWLYKAQLEAGICPNSSLVDGHVKQECSAYVIYTLGAWSAEGQAEARPVQSEKSKIVIDLARLYAGVGDDLAACGTPWKETVGHMCLERSLRLAQEELGPAHRAERSRPGEQVRADDVAGLLHVGSTGPELAEAAPGAADFAGAACAGIVKMTRDFVELALVMVAGLCFSAAHIASLRAWGL